MDRVEKPEVERTKEKRQHHLRVPVTAAEKAIIEELATRTNQSIASYLRAVGTGTPLKAKVDFEAVLALSKVGGDQGRLGGLLKKLITLVEDTGSLKAQEVRSILQSIEITQQNIKELIVKLRNFSR